MRISAIFVFLISKFVVSSKACFSSIVKGEAIANALMVSSSFCFSNCFQFIIKPLFSNNVLKFLKINSKSENLISSFFRLNHHNIFHKKFHIHDIFFRFNLFLNVKSNYSFKFYQKSSIISFFKLIIFPRHPTRYKSLEIIDLF